MYKDISAMKLLYREYANKNEEAPKCAKNDSIVALVINGNNTSEM